MHRTRHDLPEATRARMVELLNARLADAVDLQTQVKQAHWNVKGPNFIAVHQLLDTVNEAVEEAVDEIAERAVQLGGQAVGTARAAAARSKLPEYPLGATWWREHVIAVSERLSLFGRALRESIDLAAEAGDAGTADLFTQISRASDKHLWFVEAHLEESAGGAGGGGGGGRA